MIFFPNDDEYEMKGEWVRQNKQRQVQQHDDFSRRMNTINFPRVNDNHLQVPLQKASKTSRNRQRQRHHHELQDEHLDFEQLYNEGGIQQYDARRMSADQQYKSYSPRRLEGVIIDYDSEEEEKDYEYEQDQDEGYDQGPTVSRLHRNRRVHTVGNQVVHLQGRKGSQIVTR